MANIQTILEKYRPLLASLDVELILAHELKKSREFVLTYPEYTIPPIKIKNLKLKIARRRRGEPLAYLIGQKEFYGLTFQVTRATLIPRPETEMLVEKTLQTITKIKTGRATVVDLGTGTGNIIIAVAKNAKKKNLNYVGVDLSQKALRIAKKNAKKNNLTKIKFIQSNLLNYYFKNDQAIKTLDYLIILANLPYLSKKNYAATAPDVKNFEPKSALFSKANGLYHYKRLTGQLKKIKSAHPTLKIIGYWEISPEQKEELALFLNQVLPFARVTFQKDLARKWRLCEIKLE